MQRQAALTQGVSGKTRGRSSGQNAQRDSCHQKSPISQLQEYIQGSKHYPATARRAVLRWQYKSRISVVNNGLQQLMAVVSFSLEGVPHHVEGAWHRSKKLAQRDAAERALGLFVGQWGKMAADDDGISEDVRLLEEYVVELEQTSRAKGPLPSSQQVAWSVSRVGGCFRTCAEVSLLGVPHCFSGAPQITPEVAFADTARRVLWYLQRLGYENAFEPGRVLITQDKFAVPMPEDEPSSCPWTASEL